MNAHASVAGELYFFERPPLKKRRVWLFFSALVLLVDYFTGPYILFPVFFVLPVMLAAWNCSFRSALLLAVLLCSVRFLFHLHWAKWALGPVVINTLMRLGVLTLLGWVTATLGQRTRELRERLVTLQGILPICATCKDIRDENGQWHRLEAYVSQRSKAQFSHGVCPRCAGKWFDDYQNECPRQPAT